MVSDSPEAIEQQISQVTKSKMSLEKIEPVKLVIPKRDFVPNQDDDELAKQEK